MKKLIRIDDSLLEAIQKNAKTIGNTATKEINEMLWLALKPRTEQIKKVMATRAITIDQLNIKSTSAEEQDYTDEDYEKILESL